MVQGQCVRKGSGATLTGRYDIIRLLLQSHTNLSFYMKLSWELPYIISVLLIPFACLVFAQSPSKDTARRASCDRTINIDTNDDGLRNGVD